MTLVRAWRLSKTRYAATAFDGEGARRYGSRWNSKGVAVAYASSSLPLALLEVVIHLPTGAKLPAYSVITADFDDSLITDLAPSALPADWKDYPGPSSLQAIGDDWVARGKSAVLRVPSVVVESEGNFLINVAHPDYARIKLGSPQPFDLDQRLL